MTPVLSSAFNNSFGDSFDDLQHLPDHLLRLRHSAGAFRRIFGTSSALRGTACIRW
ncbi:hypothetical protein [Streptomyces sp. NPDC086766]|uniref:hypothetical protein n=1 Tax=Streptomyces sp. NPDC086766 TaxID=3365754 RepID=UPI003817A6B6